jgi:hypothetical protein
VPKLYEYFGLIVLFYSNEHEPIHVHGKYQDRESKAEIIIVEGVITEIRITNVRGKRPLEGRHLKDFEILVRYFSSDIVKKWVDYFVYHKSISSIKIQQEIT